ALRLSWPCSALFNAQDARRQTGPGGIPYQARRGPGMHTAVGIFASRAAAERAVGEGSGERSGGASHHLLNRRPVRDRILSMRTTDGEAEGMGKAMGAYLGGVVGASAGLSLGSAVASLFVPGVGPIMAAGIGAAAVLGVGGATAGATMGHATEDAMDEGIPKDDVFFYRHLLKQGRSVVLVNFDEPGQVGSERILQESDPDDRSRRAA